MKRLLLIFLVVPIIFLTSACTRTVFNQSTVNRFHELNPVHSGSTIAVLPSNESVATSLEYKTYKTKLETYLRAEGFRVVSVNSSSAPRLTALLNYGIDDGKLVTETYSVPVYGQTGVISSTTTGSVNLYGNYGSYSGTTYYTPTYGITGYTTGSTTSSVYTRVVHLDIFDSSPDPSKPRKIYEAKVVSKGACSGMNSVIDEMFTALFKNFRGPSGGSEKVEVETPFEKVSHCF